MPEYVLNYFDFNARGETPRMLFKWAGVAFEDRRIARDDWNNTIKTATPLGWLPFLEVDGVYLGQSLAICRYLAKQFGQVGKTALDEARADMVGTTVEDIFGPLARHILISRDANEKAKLIEDYFQYLDTVMKRVLNLLDNNKVGGGGFFAGDSLTWADVHVYNCVTFASKLTGSDVWERCPTLKRVKENVEKQPNLAEHIKTRPAFDK